MRGVENILARISGELALERPATFQQNMTGRAQDKPVPFRLHPRQPFRTQRWFRQTVINWIGSGGLSVRRTYGRTRSSLTSRKAGLLGVPAEKELFEKSLH